ncbi:PAS domain-containing protein [Thalassobacter stenotrophicus]|uniref:PAS domain-containing protein n=1 Tax=Thalassobacter stenotrophicus TaxID=266809 RepID=UPI003990399F
MLERAGACWSVLERDIGRPIADLNHNLDYPEFLDDIRTVVKRVKSLSREVMQSTNGAIFEVRMRP